MSIGTETRPLRVAIIGAGPAGFYAAEGLFKQANLVAQVDMYNRFPTPFGLVREGVAPDHQSIKAVTRVYDRIAENPNFKYYGNVTFGTDVFLSDLQPYYDAIIYAVGAQADRKMGIPGEDLENCFPATVFVGWYNGHPDYRDLKFDLTQERVAVIGNGNVAMDVARILASSPDELAKSDIADHALADLRESKVKEVIMLGRRGPVQAAFTNPELKEFGELEGVDVIVAPVEVELDEASAEAMASDKTATKNVEMLKKYIERTETDGNRKLVMRFLVSPVELYGTDGKVTAMKLEKNKLVPQKNGTLKAVGTGEYETIEVGLVFPSVGYKGVALKDVPFDDWSGTIPNNAGRVTDPATNATVSGQYVVGWAKRGPSGIIGTNKPDSFATVNSLIEDIPNLAPIADENRAQGAFEAVLNDKGIEFVTYADWKKIDVYETTLGKAQSRPRVKCCTVPEMLKVIKES